MHLENGDESTGRFGVGLTVRGAWDSWFA
jgi:hypothetical protein